MKKFVTLHLKVISRELSRDLYSNFYAKPIVVLEKEISDDTYSELADDTNSLEQIDWFYNKGVTMLAHGCSTRTRYWDSSKEIKFNASCFTGSQRTIITNLIKSGWKRVDGYYCYEELPIERVMKKVDRMIEKRRK